MNTEYIMALDEPAMGEVLRSYEEEEGKAARGFQEGVQAATGEFHRFPEGHLRSLAFHEQRAVLARNLRSHLSLCDARTPIQRLAAVLDFISQLEQRFLERVAIPTFSSNPIVDYRQRVQDAAEANFLLTARVRFFLRRKGG